MTTEDTTIVNSDLASWWKSPWLSVDEAMNLILGFAPSTYRFDYVNEQDMPDGSVPIYRALVQAIRGFKLPVHIRNMAITNEEAILLLNESFQENVVSYDDYLHSCWWHDGKLSTYQLIEWLEDEGFSPSSGQEINTKLKTSTDGAVNVAVTATLPPPIEMSLPLVKKRVSTEGQDNTQVRNTCRDNQEAVAYVRDRLNQGTKPEIIAAELKKVGGGVAVIGCLLDPTRANTKAAREYGKYLLKKAKK